MEESLEETAWILHIEQGLSWSQVKYHLTKEMGIEEIKARQVIDILKEKEELIEMQEEEQRAIKEQEKLIQEQEQELQDILREEEGSSAIQRADNKIMIGVIIVGISVGVILLCPNFPSRIKWLALLGGIGMIATGMKHREIITKHNNGAASTTFDEKQRNG